MAAPRARRTQRSIPRQREAQLPLVEMGAILAVALLSAAGLAWEIILTRLASATLSYHYAFVAVSLAVGGLGLGAALVYAFIGRSPMRTAAWSAGAAGVVFLLTSALVPPVVTSGGLGGLILLAVPAFVTIGAALTAIFRCVPLQAPAVYGADLIGAGVGAISSILLLNLTGPFSSLFILAIASAVAAWLLNRQVGPNRKKGDTTNRLPVVALRSALPVLVALVVVAGLGGVVAQAEWGTFGINYQQMAGAPPDKTIVPVLRTASNKAHIIATRWDAFARTDVVSTADQTQRLIFTDGGAGTYMQRWNGQLSSQKALLQDLETVPFLVGPHRNVLIIGAGGGIDVLRALEAGASHVTAVDWNRSAVAAVRAEKTYNGNILNRPNVTTVVDDGRHFLARNSQKYDTILLNLVYTGASEGTSNALAESYVFTTEAFRSYLSHLTTRGRIGIISHQALEGLRAFTTGVEALHQGGSSYADALQRSTVLMTNNQTPQTRPTLTVLQRSPFNGQQLQYLRARGTGDLNLQPLYVPLFYRGAFTKLADGTQSLDQFLQGSDYNIAPTSDNQPFFFDLAFGWPDGLATAFRYSIFLIVSVLALALSLRWPWRSRGTNASGRVSFSTLSLMGLFMGLVGVGFMCVEIPLIQHFILILGQPTIALAVVLAALLISGGLGSLLSGAVFTERIPIAAASLTVALFVVVGRLILPTIQSDLLSLSAPVAIAASILVLTPMGLVLGMPFPLGLRLIGEVSPDNLALLWTVNAVFSVLGSVVAALVAIQVGFDIALLLGAACYAVGALVLYLVTDLVPRAVPVAASRNPSSMAPSRT